METAGPVLSGATSMTAQVKLVALGAATSRNGLPPLLEHQQLLLRGPRPDRRAIKTMVNGTAAQSAIFAATVATGTWYNLKLSVDASAVLSATLGTTVVGTYTPAALASGSAAVATASMTAEFDSVVYSQP